MRSDRFYNNRLATIHALANDFELLLLNAIRQRLKYNRALS